MGLLFPLFLSQDTDYVFVVSSAISIETTWAPFLAKYQISHKVIRSPRDLRRVYPGDFILITLGRVKNYQRQIQKIVKLANRKLFLIYDEAQNASALEASEEVGRLTKATISCFHSLRYKLLMSGTSINNNVVESYPQLYLLYNASVNMLSMAKILYSFSEEGEDYIAHENPHYRKPYLPYIEGLSCFRHSHLPEKLTVFGVVQRRQAFPNRPVFTVTGIEMQPHQRRNLIYLLVAKERMLRFLKGQDISFEKLFTEMGFDLSHHRGAVFRGYDTKGRPELYWGQQQIAA